MLRKLFGFSALALGVAAALLPARSASAQQYLEAGTWELTLTGAGASNQDADAGSASLQGSLFSFTVTWLVQAHGFSLTTAGTLYATMQIAGVTGRPGRNPDDNRLRMLSIVRPADGWSGGLKPGEEAN